MEVYDLCPSFLAESLETWKFFLRKQMKTAFERDFFLEKVGVSLLEVYIYIYIFFFWWDDKVSGSFFLFFLEILMRIFR